MGTVTTHPTISLLTGSTSGIGGVFNTEWFIQINALAGVAVKIAAHHIEKRGGVMFDDVVGLGKRLSEQQSPAYLMNVVR